MQEKGVTAGKGRATPGRRAQQAESEDQEGNIVTRPIGGVREYIEGVRWNSGYQSYFSPNRAMRGPMIVDGCMKAEPPPQVMFEAASELPML